MSKYKFTCSTDNLIGTCGVGVLFEYRDYDKVSDYEKRFLDIFKPTQIQGGTGYEIAGFINTENCKLAFEYLKKNYKIVFQSELRVNRNSDNEFFFIVLDFDRLSAVDNSEFNWPEFKQGVLTDEENNDFEDF